MKKLKLGSKVLYREKVHTLLGYTKSGMSCVIEGPKGGHYGDIKAYWHNEYGIPVRFVSGDNRAFVSVASLIPVEQSEPEFIFDV